MKMEERETACLNAIKALPDDKYVLIGGYAASSFDFPRFSVDLDIVIDQANQKAFEALLKEQGFLPSAPVEIDRDVYQGQFQRYEKQGIKASVDLLINAVASRQTGASYSFNQVFKESELRDVVGFSSSAKVKARVANREMLIALKTNSMRLTDQRDIVALCNSDVEIDKIVQLMKRCPSTVILKNIEDFFQTLESHSYRDSIKGVFMLSDRVFERTTERAKSVFKSVKARLKE